MIASSTGEGSANSAITMDAKLMLATGHGDSHKLKSLPNRQDTTTTAVVASSRKQHTSAAKPSPSTMNPLLLAYACCGSLEKLSFLLTTAQSRPPAAPLLDGVTTEGDTVLHAVAKHGDGQNFQDCANFIFGKARHLLFTPNKKGDTPLHCAVRSGNSEMVSCLVGLANSSGDGCSRAVPNLLRMVNDRNETALHDAVRNGNKDIVEFLLNRDVELGRFPEEGSSPLYLAILLEKSIIVQTLYGVGAYNLSYAGANGQNALHAAVLRGPGTRFAPLT